MSNDTVSASATAQRVSDDKVIDSFIMLDRWEAGRKKPDSAKFAHTHFIVFNTSIPCPQSLFEPRIREAAIAHGYVQ